MSLEPFVTPGTGTPLKRRDEEFAIIRSAFLAKTIRSAADFIIDKDRVHWKAVEGLDNRKMKASLAYNGNDDALTGNAINAILKAAEKDLPKPSETVISHVDEWGAEFTVQSATLRRAREWAEELKRHGNPMKAAEQAWHNNFR